MKISRPISLAALLILTVGVLLAISPSKASAASLNTDTTGGVYFTSDSGETNDVTLSSSGGVLTIIDQGAPINITTINSGSCSAVNANRVDCSGIFYSRFTLDDGDDRFESQVTDPAFSSSVYGGPGSDDLTGGAGDDRLSGEDGDDSLDGAAGNDDIDPGYGMDTVAGGSGDRDRVSYQGRFAPVTASIDGTRNDGEFGEADDIAIDIEDLQGGEAGDSLTGSNAPNVLTGGLGGDLLTGLDGADSLAGEDGDDELDGGDGSDSLAPGYGTDDVAGGPGTDTVSYSDHSAGVTVSVDDVADDGEPGEGDNAHADIENIDGTNFDDLLIGNLLDNILFGRFGNDDLRGGGGEDAYFAGFGDDTVAAADGTAENVNCGPGTDGGTADGPGPNADNLIECEISFADNTAPDTSITAGPSGTIYVDHATFEFTSTEAGSTFECSRDGGPFSPCPTPYEVTGLSDGLHQLAVRATDPSGNTDASPATRFYFVDGTPPDTVITAGPADGSLTPSRDAEFSFFSTDFMGASFDCRLDGGPRTACVPPTSYEDLAPGPHTFEVRAIDQQGRPDPTPEIRSWTVTAPDPDPDPVDPGPTDPGQPDPVTPDPVTPDPVTPVTKRPPVAVIKTSDRCVLDGRGSTALDGKRIAAYQWNFGAKVLGRKGTLRYCVKRTTTLVLTVRDSEGASASEKVTVKPPKAKKKPAAPVIRLTIPNALFAFDSARPSKSAKRFFTRTRKTLCGASSISLTGNTDSIGTRAYNVSLGARRARAVQRLLAMSKCPGKDPKIRVRSLGESRPLVSNQTARGRALNRRVEVIARGRVVAKPRPAAGK